MTNDDRIQALLKEAEIYFTQGLYEASVQKYHEILEMAETDEGISRDILDLVDEKLRTVEETIKEVDEAPDAVELPEEVQGLISNLFSFSQNEDTAAVESAVALATFGQYDKAISEFERLLNEGILPKIVAKNMLKCHLTFGAYEAAILQFEEWVSHSMFSGMELVNLRNYLSSLLEQEGISADLSQIEDISTGEEDEADLIEQTFSELSSIKVFFDKQHIKDPIRNFDVNYQVGNCVTIDVKDNEEDLLPLMESGVRFSKIQCFGDFYMFEAKGVISEKKMVTEGPKRGSYSVDLALFKP